MYKWYNKGSYFLILVLRVQAHFNYVIFALDCFFCASFLLLFDFLTSTNIKITFFTYSPNHIHDLPIFFVDNIKSIIK